MPWLYEQTTGRLFDPDGKFLADGYSGGGTDPENTAAITGKNNPTAQNVHMIGPIPQGTWTIGEPVNSATHGRYAMMLTPDANTDTFGRDHFLIHGDSIPNPGFASDGCVIMPYDARVKIWESGDHCLQVVGEMESE
jgi:Protein of unknown function (DUF2778)